MAKRRIVGLIFSSIIAIGAMVFSHAPKDNNYIVHAEEQLVGTPEISWNNVDYSSGMSQDWCPDKNNLGVPQSGYCLLALYPSEIASTTYTSENFLTANIPNCNVGDYILINGIPSKNVTDVIIYGYPQKGFFLYVPHHSVNFCDEYEYVTIEVREGMSIDGTARTEATRFEYRGLLGSFNNWQVNPEPIEKVQGEFTKIDWDNMDFSFGLEQQWCGELMPNGAPKDGYCLLAFFNEIGKNYKDSEIGDVMTNGRGVLGIGLNADYKIKVNGVNIIDVEDAKCYIYPKYGLFFYIPEASLIYNETYTCPTITIEEGLHFNNVYLPYISFEFRATIGTPHGWAYIKDEASYKHVNFTKVADLWNNVPADGSHNATILQYGEYGVDYLKNDHASDATNMVSRYSDVGKNITLNGKSIWEYGDVLVSYIHGYCYVYCVFPVSALKPSNGYRIPTLHVSRNTIFYDSMLGEINLYLFNGKWILDKPDTPDDSDFEHAFSFSYTFGVEEATLDDNNKQMVASKENTVTDFSLFFNYKMKESGSAFVLYALGNRAQNGLRLVLIDDTIHLYDSTEGNVLLGEATITSFNYDEWYSLLLYTKVVDDKMLVGVAVDGVTQIKVENFQFTNDENVGNYFSLNLGNGAASFKDAVMDGDNKKPILSFSGKSVYSVLAGSDAIDFKNKCSATDVVDGNLNKKIVYSWPDGALTNDNKINKGIWEVNISVEDKSHNKAELNVTVISADKLEVTVTFDGKNPVNYRVGDHIACIAEPIKEGYRFIGWYFNNRLWDFENDYVLADMNLESRFQATVDEYLISFTVEGLPGVKSYSLYFRYGAEINISTFAKEGYDLKAYIGEEEVNTITVNDNMNVRLVYTSLNPNNKKKGCGGDITSATLLIPLIAGASLILLVFLKKKGGKEHE